MRIVGGQLRGRRLAALGAGDAGAHLRPTSDRVREALFNVLEHRYGLSGRRVLDLFAGTGALGLEALSRGAEAALFVENGAKSGALIRQNIDTLGVGAAARLLRRDATDLGQVTGEPFDLIFLDPPYGKGLGARALSSARAGGWLSADAVFVLEDASEVPLPEGITAEDTRRYGDTVLQIGVV